MYNNNKEIIINGATPEGISQKDKKMPHIEVIFTDLTNAQTHHLWGFCVTFYSQRLLCVVYNIVIFTVYSPTFKSPKGVPI